MVVFHSQGSFFDIMHAPIMGGGQYMNRNDYIHKLVQRFGEDKRNEIEQLYCQFEETLDAASKRVEMTQGIMTNHFIPFMACEKTHRQLRRRQRDLAPV